MARPRKHPDGTTASDRKAMARSALASAGGATRQFGLSPRAVESMALIRSSASDVSDTALIERLLEAERGRIQGL